MLCMVVSFCFTGRIFCLLFLWIIWLVKYRYVVICSMSLMYYMYI